MQRFIPLCVLLIASMVGCTGTAGGQKIYEQGMDEANAGNLEAAVETLKKGVNNFPGNLDMRLGLARLQFERGMIFHERELQLRRDAAALLESDRRDEGASASRAATLAHNQAVPLFKSCHEQVDVVISDSDEAKKVAWASYLAMRVSLFFEDYYEAYEHITRAIHEGKPTGQLLTNWRNFQASLKEKAGGPREQD